MKRERRVAERKEREGGKKGKGGREGGRQGMEREKGRERMNQELIIPREIKTYELAKENGRSVTCRTPSEYVGGKCAFPATVRSLCSNLIGSTLLA